MTADHTGLAISLTTTVNLYFGSQILTPETGILLNDEMAGNVISPVDDNMPTS